MGPNKGFAAQRHLKRKACIRLTAAYSKDWLTLLIRERGGMTGKSESEGIKGKGRGAEGLDEIVAWKEEGGKARGLSTR